MDYFVFACYFNLPFVSPLAEKKRDRTIRYLQPQTADSRHLMAVNSRL